MRRYCFIFIVLLFCAVSMQAQNGPTGDDSKVRRQIVEFLESGEKAETEGSQTLAENYFQQAANLLGSLSESGTLVYKTLSGRRVQAVKFLRDKGFVAQKTVQKPQPAPEKPQKEAARPEVRVDTVYIVREEQPVQQKEQEIKTINIKVENVLPVRNEPAEVARTAAPVTPAVPARQRPSVFVLASVSPLPALSGGLMAGAVGRVGGYAKFSSDWRFAKPAYECMSDGSTSFGTVWTTGARCVSSLAATAGVCFAAGKWLIPYVGAGYGKKDLLWEDSSGDMVRVSDYSFRGVAAEAGLIGRIGKFALSAGVGTVGFKVLRLDFGVGIVF